MKYRRLTKEELEPLAEDFAIFLASNSLDKKQWDDIKENKPDKAEELLDIFSDMVFEKALKSAKYLERLSDTEIHCYAFLAKSAHMISVRMIEKYSTDFTNCDLKSTLTKLLEQNNLEMIQGTKKYRKQRESEIFEVLKTGALLSKGELYQMLLSLI